MDNCPYEENVKNIFIFIVKCFLGVSELEEPIGLTITFLFLRKHIF